MKRENELLHIVCGWRRIQLHPVQPKVWCVKTVPKRLPLTLHIRGAVFIVENSNRNYFFSCLSVIQTHKFVLER